MALGSAESDLNTVHPDLRTSRKANEPGLVSDRQVKIFGEPHPEHGQVDQVDLSHKCLANPPRVSGCHSARHYHSDLRFQRTYHDRLG